MKLATVSEAENPYSWKMEIAKALETSSEVSDRIKSTRKSLIQLRKFIEDVLRWQKERPPLFETDTNLDILTVLLLGEIEEVSELRELEGLKGYDFKSEKGETIDAGFFLACVDHMVRSLGGDIDHQRALATANGHAKGSRAIELLREVSGNLSKKTLEKDLQYLWTLWISYLIHMKYPVSPNRVLHEYTLPKNNGNYVKELLQGNPIFERAFNRKMDRDEKIAYFAHYRKAMRLIRDFILKYVDPNVEHTGLKPEHYRPYKIFIYSFMNFSSVGLNPQKALEMLESQLYVDFKVARTPQTPAILRPNHRLPN
ncbi:MAG: hypothetical protein BroJett025_00820 [Patescibacteria group bacterium]|nr:MAG: hypothetical protein BroJett025_00820 [Patescibacteria group bacterium]